MKNTYLSPSSVQQIDILDFIPVVFLVTLFQLISQHLFIALIIQIPEFRWHIASSIAVSIFLHSEHVVGKYIFVTRWQFFFLLSEILRKSHLNLRSGNQVVVFLLKLQSGDLFLLGTFYFLDFELFFSLHRYLFWAFFLLWGKLFDLIENDYFRVR